MCVCVFRAEESPERGSSEYSVFSEARKTHCGALESWCGNPASPWLCDLGQGFELCKLLIKSVMGRPVMETGGGLWEHSGGAQVQAEG